MKKECIRIGPFALVHLFKWQSFCFKTKNNYFMKYVSLFWLFWDDLIFSFLWFFKYCCMKTIASKASSLNPFLIFVQKYPMILNALSGSVLVGFIDNNAFTYIMKTSSLIWPDRYVLYVNTYDQLIDLLSFSIRI